ncbi:MAG: serine/threonine-protein kinase [Myxococcota bacterium]
MSTTEPRQYRILDVLGRGGFGTVYRAELHGAGGFVKEVALKVLNPEVEASTDHLARLRDEARVLGLVRHRALIGVDGLVRLLDRWTVVMEYVDGVALDELLTWGGPFPIAVTLQIVEEAANGLHAAYSSVDRDGRPLRLVHRDVKPSNLLLTRHGEVKLLDFGVARAEFASREALTGSVVFGSVPYLAPERLDLEDSHASDVYALAVTAVQLITGVVPSTPTGDPVRHAARVAEVARLLRESAAQPELIALIERCLAWDPTARPDARELERTCRAIRSTGVDHHVGEWAEDAVGRYRAAHAAQAGEYTGMWAAEAATTEKHRHLADLLGTSAPTTFDDPVTTDVPVAAPNVAVVADRPPPATRGKTPSVAPRSATPRSVTRSATPASVTPRSTVPTSERPPRRRSRLGWLVAAVVALATVIVGVTIVIGSAMLGGTAVFGALVIAAISDSTSACVSTVRSTRQDLAAKDTRGMRRADVLFDRANKACRDGSLGFWTGVLVMADVRTRADDGTLSDDDLTALDRQLTEFLKP